MPIAIDTACGGASYVAASANRAPPHSASYVRESLGDGGHPREDDPGAPPTPLAGDHDALHAPVAGVDVVAVHKGTGVVQMDSKRTGSRSALNAVFPAPPPGTVETGEAARTIAQAWLDATMEKWSANGAGRGLLDVVLAAVAQRRRELLPFVLGKLHGPGEQLRGGDHES